MAYDSPTGSPTPPLRRQRRSIAARAYIGLGTRSVSIALGLCATIVVLALLSGLRLFDAWDEQRTRAQTLEAELHHRWAEEVARQLDRLDRRTQRLLKLNLAAVSSGLLLDGEKDADAITRFFWDQLEAAPETGYLGLLRLDGTLSGIGVRRRPDGELRVESVAFQNPVEGSRAASDPMAGRRRQFFRLDALGQPVGRIVEHDFNSPWDRDLETALIQARDQDWRGLYGWALGNPVPGLEVEPILSSEGRPTALLATAPAFGELVLSGHGPSNLDVWLLDSGGRILARSEAAPQPASRLKERLADLPAVGPARIPTDPSSGSSMLHLTPWPRDSERSPGLWIATRARQHLRRALESRPPLPDPLSP